LTKNLWLRVHFVMRRGMGAVLLAACLAGPAFSQSQPVQPPPDYILYRAFFLDVTFYHTVAAQLQARGKDPAPARSKIKIEAGLTDQEQAQLQAIAQDLDAALAAYDQSAARVIGGLRTQYPPGATLPPAVKQQLKGLGSARQQIVVDHVQQLKSALGAVRFHQLDKYVRATTGRRLKRGAASTTVTAPAPAQR